MDLRNREDDEEIEPEAFERPDVVGGNGTCVPHEFTTTHHQRLPRHVRQPELQPQVKQVHSVHTRPQHRHDGRQPTVHIQARSPLAANGYDVKEEGIHCQGHPTDE